MSEYERRRNRAKEELELIQAAQEDERQSAFREVLGWINEFDEEYISDKYKYYCMLTRLETRIKSQIKKGGGGE